MGGIRLTIRLEELLKFAVAIALYRQAGGGWGLFALLFLVPDVTMLAYLASPRFGALVYNAAHSYLGALALTLAGFTLLPAVKLVALIWVAHIAFDRAMGYGLKYSDDFGHTHLGLIGPAARAARAIAPAAS